jgi:5-methylcytosine-specific restriction endonuclease McrA
VNPNSYPQLVAAEASPDYVIATAFDPPSAEAQLDFLAKLQRIFDEGEFTATYKFALLIALTQLAVEHGSDDNRPLRIRTTAIAEKFGELYWPQTLLYGADASRALPDILAQNLGKTARVISVLRELRASTGASTVAAARRTAEWSAAVGEIARTVRDQPLQFLQNVGGRAVPFLYRIGPLRGETELHAGVASNLRRFQGLIHQIARAGWVRHVRENPRNSALIGARGDLESFMFGLTRSNLEPARDFLAKIQSGHCFYCGDRIGPKGEVDHFVPWVKYPRDLAHNLVLAHEACNRSKSDMLASCMHLETWRKRNDLRGDEIGEELADRAFLVDGMCSLVVARWAYRQAADSGAHAWAGKARLEPIGPAHLAALG